MIRHLKQFIADSRGPLTRADRPRWAAARTLDDLAELTAQWLEGHIDSQPGYYGRVDVDEDLAPGLTRALLMCNRAGLLTKTSQAGYTDTTDLWQLAAVGGFAYPRTVAQLRTALRGTPFSVYTQPFWGRDEGVVVTTYRGQRLTSFGARIRRLHLDAMFHGCSKQAIAAVQETLQVVIYDPTPGRNTLWPALSRAADRLAGRPTPNNP